MLCVHPLMRHTAWYWIEDPNDPVPVPYELHFDNRKDALEFASELIVDPPNRLRWLKIFRAHNEVYECYRWENPEPYILPRPRGPELSGVLIDEAARFNNKPWWKRIQIGEGEEREHWWQLRK